MIYEHPTTAELVKISGERPTTINRRLGGLAKIFAPGYGCCLKCLTPWRFVNAHMTRVTALSGCFPLCEKCWSEMTPEERLPYYRDLFSAWDNPDPDWHAIEAVVRAGG